MSDKTEKDSGKMVTAPYVTAKVKDVAGQPVTLGFYEGSILPADVDPDDLERLERKGMVADVDSPEGKMAAPAGTPKPGEPPNVPVTEQPVTALPLAERQARQAEAAKQADESGSRRGRPRSESKPDS